jgi:RNA polymerase sigma factor (sigma-70 family)
MHIFLIKLKDKFFIQGSDYEDIYQEGAIKLMNVIEKFDANKGNFMTFAQQAIEKHIITCINREKAQKRMHLNNALSLNVEMNSNDSDEKMTFLDNISDDRNLENYNPIEIVQKDYELYIIEEISKELSEMEAKVFYLRFMEHYSYKDIAIELGFFKKGKAKASPDQKSIDNAIMRSRPKIKKVLEKLGLSPKDILNPPKKKKDNSLRQKIEKGIKEIQERSQPESPRELTRRKATESKKIADSKKTIEPKKRKK